MYSIIIPSLGRINYLNNLLESIYLQTLLPREVIIIFDDNEKCRSIENLILRKNLVKVIFYKNLTTSQKRNAGVSIAKSDNIIFSDDDDYWEVNKGELTIASLKNCQVVCHAFSKFGSLDKKKYHLGRKKKFINIFSLIAGDNIFGGGSGIAGKKEIFLSIPFNQEFYSEDYDWWIKIILSEIKVEYLPISLVRYRSHNSNMTLNSFKIYFYNAKIFNKLFIKSVILFSTFIVGYFKIIIKLNIKLIKFFFLL